MKRKDIRAKVMPAVLATTMMAGTVPATAFAATGNQVAADGTYKAAVKVTRTAEDDADENEWDEYDVTVALEVKDGKFANVTVTPGSNYNAAANQTYFNKATNNKDKGISKKLNGQDATEDSIKKWDSVSGATRTSAAVKEAALDAIHQAKEAKEEVSVDVNALEAAIADAEKLVEKDYTADSWKAFQTALTDAKAVTAAKESQEKVDAAEKALKEARASLVKAEVQAPEEKVQYVLMNIPYDEFYKADLNNDVRVDVFSSATKSKARSGLAAGSYHANTDASQIDGVTFPVKVTEGVDLSKYTQVTDKDSVVITNTQRRQTSTTTYAGKDALFEKATYAYYVLDEAPAYYKEVTVNADGSLSFGKTVGIATPLSGVNAELLTTTVYGDYQLNLDGLTDTIPTSSQVYGVIVSTKEGHDYGMRHLENIWRVSELAWSTGFTTTVHDCKTDSEHYKAMMGETINKVTYYTSQGIYELPMDVYVPEKFENTVKVEDAEAASGKTDVTVEGLPSDYNAEYKVEGLDMSINGSTMIFKDASNGSYKLVISDTNKKYADLSASFTLTTSEMPAAYNNDAKEPALVAADGATAEKFANYLNNISSVSVNGKKYNASGRGSVAIIDKKTGKINLEAAANDTKIFEGADKYEISVVSNSYTSSLDFSIDTAEEPYKYVYAGLTWAEYWAAEDVQEAGSADSSEEKDTKGELDKGAFDTVSRATTNHGLHRGSFQCMATIFMKDGTTYDVAYYTGATSAVLTDGTSISYSKGDIDHYVVTGLKYVPVKVASEDYEAFCEKYPFVENGGKLSGGFSENKLAAYTDVEANVTEATNGLKTVTKNDDDSFSFSSRAVGSESGIKDSALKTASGIEVTVKEANGSYGEFLRVDLNGDYGDLAANMQTVKWTYYGEDSTYSTPVASYGTKFAADNWMHKVMGIQLGLTDSLRTTLPEGTDGTGYWTLTVYALGYEDYTVQFEATDANIVKADPVKDTSALEAAIAEAESLKQGDYTEDSWNNMQTELAEAKEELSKKHSQSAVDEATEHLNAAIKALAEKPVVEEPKTVEYQIIFGDKGSYTIGSNENYTLKADGELADFKGLQMDGQDVDTANYTASQGSTVVTLKSEYLDTLATGEHKITLQYEDGTANGTFTVSAAQDDVVQADTSSLEKNAGNKDTSGAKNNNSNAKSETSAASGKRKASAAKTGDTAGVMGLLTAAAASLATGGTVLFRKRRRKEEE